MAYLLGALLGAAAAAALQAVAMAYVVGLLVSALVVAAVPVLVAAVVARPKPSSHWFARPAALGALLAAGAAGAVALSVRLIGSGEDVHFVRPFAPGLLAAPVDAVLLLWLAVRGARSARAALQGSADVRAGATSMAALAGRAVSRGAAVVVFGVGSLVLFGGIALTIGSKDAEANGGGFIMLGAIVAFLVGGLGSLFAWWGRRRGTTV